MPACEYEVTMAVKEARFYDPDLGRFLQIDPAREFWSGYSYAGNNPSIKIDKTGKISGGASGSLNLGIPGLFGEIGVGGQIGNEVKVQNMFSKNAFTSFGFDFYNFNTIGLGIGLDATASITLDFTLGPAANIHTGKGKMAKLDLSWLIEGASGAIGMTEDGWSEFKQSFSPGPNFSLLKTAETLINDTTFSVGWAGGVAFYGGIGNSDSRVHWDGDIKNFLESDLVNWIKNKYNDFNRRIHKIKDKYEPFL